MRLRPFLITLSFCAMLGSSWSLAADSKAADAAGSDNRVLAKIGDMTLTDEQAHKDIGGSLYEPETKIYDAEKAWIDAQARDYYFNQAAKAAGLSRADWERREIDGKVAAPTPKDIDDVLQPMPANRRPSTQQVADYLSNQRRADRVTQLTNELSAKGSMQVYIKPPKVPSLYSAQDPAMGPNNAPVTIVEFTDFECPYCRLSQDTLSQVEKKYGKNLKLVARQYPLYFHSRAKPSAEASLCANEQGKFWEFRAKLFRQVPLSYWKSLAKEMGLETSKFNSCLESHKYAVSTDTSVASVPLYGGYSHEALLCARDQGKFNEYMTQVRNPGLDDADYKRYASEVGMSVSSFEKCYAEHRYAAKVDQDIAEGQKLGVNGTPHFFINGRSLSGAQPLPAFQQIIDPELAKKK
jgi:protein-disulfide isomerase